MDTLYDPTTVGHTEARIPDLRNPQEHHTTSTPGGCTCTRNYAHPHYLPCAHVRLLRTGFDLRGVWTGVFDGTPVYVLSTRESYESVSPRTNGHKRPGRWRYALLFDGADAHVLSKHAQSGLTRIEYLPPARWAEWKTGRE